MCMLHSSFQLCIRYTSVVSYVQMLHSSYHVRIVYVAGVIYVYIV